MHFKSLESVVIIFTEQDAAHSVALLLLNDRKYSTCILIQHDIEEHEFKFLYHLLHNIPH